MRNAAAVRALPATSTSSHTGRRLASAGQSEAATLAPKMTTSAAAAASTNAAAISRAWWAL